MLEQERKFLIEVSESYPYPIANSCWNYLNNPPKDSWEEWGVLSRDILGSILKYLSHILLEDLVYIGEKPPILYHRIQQILSRPTAGQYLGFLRETSRYYKEKGLKSRLNKLVDFIYKSEIKHELIEGEGLLEKLVNLRNTYAHGRIDNEEVVDNIAKKIKELTIKLLKEMKFIKEYQLVTEEGMVLMGYKPDILKGSKEHRLYLKIENDDIDLRPLLIKSKGEDIVLIEDHDIKRMRLVYKGVKEYEEYRKKDVKKGKGKELFELLIELLKKVRSDEVELDRYDFESFRERAGVITERTLSLYEEMRKYIPAYYITRPEWDGKDGIVERFIKSDKNILMISGEQGSGKSALVSTLAKRYKEEGNAVLFINAQRFSFAEVSWSDNPYPKYFSEELRYKPLFDKKGIKSLLKGIPEGKRLLIFIDGINEIEGITNKWNRFKALHKLLEWVSGVGDKRFKVIISFRAEEYLEFEQLDKEYLPENMEDITYKDDKGNWILELSKFNIEQAEKLYNKLQKYSDDLGMAPDMSWEEFVKQMGNKIEEFTNNPLIFTILLKIHHKSKKIWMRDKDELFLEYANKLTGTKELKKKSLFKRIIGFFINGNITRKERFLANIISKMSEVGASSFLLSSLNFKKKRDKEILEFVNDVNSEDYKDLKEGGLIIEEKIEINKKGKEIYDRRVSFVAELMAAAMEKILKKKENFERFKQKLYGALFFLMMFFLVILLSSLISPVLRPIIKRFLSYLIFMVLLFITVINFKTIDSFVSMKEVGILAKSFNHFRDIQNVKEVYRFFIVYAFPISLISITLLILDLNKKIELDTFAIVIPLISLIVLLLFVPLSAKFYTFFFKVNNLDLNIKFLKGFSRRLLFYYKQKDKIKKLRLSVLKNLMLTTGISILFMFSYFEYKSFFVRYLRSLNRLWSPILNTFNYPKIYLNVIIFILVLLIVFVIGVPFLGSRTIRLVLENFLSEKRLKSVKYYDLKLIGILFLINVILYGLYFLFR